MESLSDIVAQMRGRGEDGRMDRRLWLDYADRIEAAWKREREELREAATEKMLEGATIIDNRGQGNAAAIYSALVKIHDLTNALDEKCGVDPVEIRDIARAALSAPARNCDVQYKDRVEMYYAFKDWCKAKGHTIEPMLAYDAFDWLLAPAAERKGEGDAE